MLGGDGGGDTDGDGRAADGHGSDGPRSERRRAVDAAVVVLRHAVGGAGAGARYLKHVDQWVARLDPSASKLVPLSSANGPGYPAARMAPCARGAVSDYYRRDA